MNKNCKITLGMIVGLFRQKDSGRWFLLRVYLLGLVWPLLSLVLIGAGLTILAYALGAAFAAGFASAWQASPPDVTLTLRIPE